MITYDPNGGDLGRGFLISGLGLQTVAPHIANILQELRDFDPNKHFKYGFELRPTEKEIALNVIHILSLALPSNVFWYEMDGKYLFEIRGQSGGVATSLICYLITK